MRIPRRSLIKTTPAVAIGIAGCTDSGNSDSGANDNGNNDNINRNTERPDADNDGVPDGRDDYPNDPDRSQQLRYISDTRNIEEDHWRYYTLEFSQAGTIEYDFIVRDGPSIDVILMDESEYQYYESEERWEYYTRLSSLDSIEDNMQGQLSAGTYRLIFDNTNQGSAAPPANLNNDVASVDYTIETSQ